MTSSRPLSALLIAALMSGSASFPELDGKPVTAMRAGDFQRHLPQELPITVQDFGDPGLRRMLAEADVNGLDLAGARARATLADLTLAQAQGTRLPQPAGTASLTDKAATVNLSLSYEIDLSGRIASAIRTAEIEHQAAGVDLLIARRTLVREVILGWIALGETRTAAARAEDRRRLARAQIPIVEARIAAGEVTAASLTEALQRLAATEESAAQAAGQIALAEARLRALGVTTIPEAIRLRDIRLPGVPAETDLGRARARPEVCLASSSSSPPIPLVPMRFLPRGPALSLPARCPRPPRPWPGFSRAILRPLRPRSRWKARFLTRVRRAAMSTVPASRRPRPKSPGCKSSPGVKSPSWKPRSNWPEPMPRWPLPARAMKPRKPNSPAARRVSRRVKTTGPG